MKQRVPKAVDELMWLVAEQRDAAAIEGFSQRYPALRSELLRRVELVRNLKSARGPKIASGDVPVFRPRHLAHERRAIPRWTWSVAASFGLALVAYGSYSILISKALVSKPIEASALSQPEPLGLSDAPITPKREPRLQYSADPKERNVARAPEVPAERVITLKYDRIRLVEALAAISAASGVKIELAPKMPNPDVVLDYPGMSVSEILADMGASFGFTAFKQSDNAYLIIPAVDPDRREVTDGGGESPENRIQPTAEGGTESGSGGNSNSHHATAQENR